jgi:hypothetical protein
MQVVQTESVTRQPAVSRSTVVRTTKKIDADVRRVDGTIVVKLRGQRTCREDRDRPRLVKRTNGTRAEVSFVALEASCAAGGVLVTAIAAKDGVCFGYGCRSSEKSFYMAAVGTSVALGCGIATVVDLLAGDVVVTEQIEHDWQTSCSACDAAFPNTRVELMLGSEPPLTTMTDESSEARFELSASDFGAAESLLCDVVVHGEVVWTGKLDRPRSE